MLLYYPPGGGPDALISRATQYSLKRVALIKHMGGPF